MSIGPNLPPPSLDDLTTTAARLESMSDAEIEAHAEEILERSGAPFNKDQVVSQLKSKQKILQQMKQRGVDINTTSGISVEDLVRLKSGLPILPPSGANADELASHFEAVSSSANQWFDTHKLNVIFEMMLILIEILKETKNAMSDQVIQSIGLAREMAALTADVIRESAKFEAIALQAKADKFRTQAFIQFATAGVQFTAAAYMGKKSYSWAKKDKIAQQTGQKAASETGRQGVLFTVGGIKDGSSSLGQAISSLAESEALVDEKKAILVKADMDAIKAIIDQLNGIIQQHMGKMGEEWKEVAQEINQLFQQMIKWMDENMQAHSLKG